MNKMKATGVPRVNGNEVENINSTFVKTDAWVTGSNGFNINDSDIDRWCRR